jgi:hypothetical protein
MASVLLVRGLAALLLCSFAAAPASEEFRVYGEHPRLLLRSQKLRLLRREHERQSPRWQQFELLVRGRAQMPEPAFAAALYYQVTGDRTIGRQAVDWALGPGADLRQLALVYDWCRLLLTDAESTQLAAKLRRGLDETQRSTDARTVRSRVFAAVVLADHGPDTSDILANAVEQWWRQNTAPALKEGRLSFDRVDLYALVEMCYAVRDNLTIDLRQDAPAWFLELPNTLLLSYYPAPFPAAENEYRVPMYDGNADPDTAAMSFARAGELALVGYDSNLRSIQYLQGWLMHDQYVMRGALGAPYEFLWANPYLPGLSYFHMSLFVHDPTSGDLYLRSSWDDDARWLGYRHGKAQVFQDGRRFTLDPASQKKAVDIGDASVITAVNPIRIDRGPDAPPNVFLIGLQPGRHYLIEVDDEELTEGVADRGGTLPILSTRNDPRAIRIRERPQ